MKLNFSVISPILFFSSVVCLGQGPPEKAAPAVEPQGVRRLALRIESTTDVVFATNPFIVAPIVCGSGGEIFVRTASSRDVGNLLAISNDGKWITSFDSGRLNVIGNPTQVSFFIRDSDVYILVRASEADGATRTLRSPDGSSESLPSSIIRFFIVRFKRDGSYLGTVPLDIPFIPLQAGAFADGSFLVAGTTKDRQEARVALVRSNGQFNRYVELKEDIRLRSDPGAGSESEAGKDSIPRIGKHLGEGFADAIQISTVIADGRNLLLVRKGQRSPVFSISPAGEVDAIRISVPEGHNIWDIKTTPRFWVALFMHRLAEGSGVEFSAMAVDRATGKILETYSYERFPGFGLACADGTEFSFLIREDNKLKILTLTANSQIKSEKK